LITTAAGLSVAIPSLIGYRYLRGRVDALVVQMEKEAITLVEALHRRLYLDTLGRPDESPQR
jgi:biopolymer transport protein ExbB